MRRRDLLAGVLATATASAVHAQQPFSKVWRVAALYPGTLGDPERGVWAAFVSELGSRGYIEGKNLILDLRDAKLPERVPPIMDELIALRPDVIVAIGNSVTAAAQHATATIPIVMWSVVDPVRNGLVSSLAHPGGNTTGAGTVAGVTLSKAIELLHLLAPAAHRVAVLWFPPTDGVDLVPYFDWVKKAADAMGLTVVQLISAPTPADLDRAFAEIVAKECEALFVPLSYHIGPAIPSRAAKSKLPAVYQLRNFVEDGGLASYGEDHKEIARRVAYLVDRIFKGTRPADLPVEEPVTFELAVNLKAAAAIGLTIPEAVLALADKVIE
jgi:putative tryptophan/tyrosine transport system substrate-binding protein